MDIKYRDSRHEYQKLIFSELNKEPKKILILKNEIIKYKSDFPYHEALLFQIIQDPSIVFKVKDNFILFKKGIKLSRLNLDGIDISRILKSIILKLDSYHKKCGFVHGNLTLDSIITYDNEFYFIKCQKSCYEYLGEVFSEDSSIKLPRKDILTLILDIYLRLKNVKSKKYLETVFANICDTSLEKIKVSKKIPDADIVQNINFGDFLHFC